MAGDSNTVLACYSEDGVAVTASTGSTVSATDSGHFVKILIDKIPDFRYEQVRRRATESGFVQQHVIRGTSPTGVQFTIPACCVATVMGGRVTRLEEYFDNAQMSAIGLL